MPPFSVKRAGAAPRAGAGARGLSNLGPGELRDLPEELRRNRLFGPEFRRFGVHDDGSCFFHTICAALNLSGYRGKDPERRARIGRQLRRLMQKEISQKKWDRVWKQRQVRSGASLPSLERIRGMLGNYRTWADVYMILYVMDRLNLNMLFFDASSDQLYCGVRGLDADKQKTVFVLWVNHAHFEPICCENPGGREPTFCYSTDDPDVKRMMKLYRQELCTGDQDDVNMLLG